MTEEINKNIKLIRIGKGLKQEDVAKMLNLSQGSYQKIESGFTKLSEKKLKKIADVFEMETSQILNYHINHNALIDSALLKSNKQDVETNEKLLNRIQELEQKIAGFKSELPSMLIDPLIDVLGLVQKKDKSIKESELKIKMKEVAIVEIFSGYLEKKLLDESDINSLINDFLKLYQKLKLRKK